jgi:hypothetical protein
MLKARANGQWPAALAVLPTFGWVPLFVSFDFLIFCSNPQASQHGAALCMSLLGVGSQ